MSKKVMISVGVAIIIAVIAYFIIQNKNSEITNSSSSIRQMISDGPVIIGSKENDVVAHGQEVSEEQGVIDSAAGVNQGMLASPVDYGIDFSNPM